MGGARAQGVIEGVKLKNIIYLGVAIALAAVALNKLSERPAQPSRIVDAEVIALSEDAEILGLRHITLRFEDGSERTIETYAPFFYRIGYTAHVGIFERTLLDDIYDVVSGTAKAAGDG